ncbi:metal-sensitive transcriptional regulator [Nigerium massiliense]|uniref:metal-sensitive transcriptional regulator n=1 Tax=Nigerium massiliense TaxID=1522317 RepID=UPI0009E3BEE2
MTDHKSTTADSSVPSADGAAGHPQGEHGSEWHDPAVGHAYIGNKEGYLRRLRRIEGQARGIARMVDEEQYCIDILTQISATTKALQSVALGLLEDHMNHCVVAAAQAGGDEAEEKVAEASEAIARLVRS